MRQVMENTESTKRQYALRQRAVALGWAVDRVIVIDSDQGESGASAVWREGFQRLVTEVGLGRAGIVMGLEVSRLARNNADWHRLLEICALSQTLILDEDGVYDPTCYNDRMLLGLKGTMSEAELHVLKARLRGGILNKARRGEYRAPLPTGLVHDEKGNVVLDSDSQVRSALAYFFETFRRVGSAHQTVKVFRRENLLFPSRMNRNGYNQIVFQKLTASSAIRTLRNPRYAGAYTYGRRSYRRTVKGKHIRDIPNCDDWIACIPDAHPGYITWEQYQQNLHILQANGQGYRNAHEAPPREGAALLQGRAICGVCGSRMRVRYAERRGRIDSWYVCDRNNAAYGGKECQTVHGRTVDLVIGRLVAEQMTPAAIELTLSIRREIESRQEEADQLRQKAVQRAQIEASLAERRYMMVDPGNRLVADTLEADWNSKLRTLAEACDEREKRKRQDQIAMDDTISTRLINMTQDFNRLWTDPATPNRERKRMIAHIIEDVTLLKSGETQHTTVHVRFKGGKTETLMADNPRTHAEKIKTSPQVVKLVDELLADFTFSEIACRLNELGVKPGGAADPGKSDQSFCSKRVAYIAQAYGLQSRYDRLRSRGMLTTTELAERLQIHPLTLKKWGEHGLVRRHAYNGHAYLYEIPATDLPPKQCSRWNPVAERAASMASQPAENINLYLEP